MSFGVLPLRHFYPTMGMTSPLPNNALLLLPTTLLLPHFSSTNLGSLPKTYITFFNPHILRYLFASKISNMTSNESPDQQASMLAGHAQYAKGYAEETIGNVTGSKEWQESGKKDAQEGIKEMKVGFLFISIVATYSCCFNYFF